MAKYLVMYQWYEFTSKSIIIADDKEQAIKEHVRLCSKLDCNYRLERIYGYGGSISPFFMDYDDEEINFDEQYNKFMESSDRGEFEVIDLSDDLVGLLTDKGLYNGENE